MYHTIRPIQVGKFPSFEKSIFLMGIDPGAKISCPCVSWLIECENGDKILVDTGPHSTDYPTAKYHSGYGKVEQEEHERIDRALSAQGVNPDEVKTVIFTHLHWDHCHSASYLKNATFYVQRKEIHYAIDPIPWHYGSFETGLPGVKPPWFDVFDRMKIVEGDVEIAPGVQILFLPGHTPGSAGVAVKTKKGTIVIAGDTIPMMENWEGIGARRRIPSALMTNVFEYYESFQKIEKVADVVLPAHDFRVFDQKKWG